MRSPDRTLLTRTIPPATALPWVLLLGLSPFWIGYLVSAVRYPAEAALWLASPHHNPHQVIGDDFLVFWSVGHLLGTHHPGTIYDKLRFSQWCAAHLAKNISPYLQYFYPPPGLILPILAAPFRFMPGYLIWTTFLSLTSLMLLRSARVPNLIILLAMFSAASLHDVITGQIGLLTNSIFIVGLLGIDRTPGRAGGLWGLLAIKPQAGLLAPFIVLARRRYVAIPSGLAVLAGLCLMVTWLAGREIWSDYLIHGLNTAHHILIAPFPTFWEIRGVSIFWMARSLGASVTASWTVQVAGASLAIAWCWIAWRRPATDHVALVALTSALTLLVTPYGYTTDLCGFSMMIAWLAWERQRLEVGDVLMWMWPALCPLVATALHVELTPLVLLLGATRAWRRLAGIGTPAAACYPAPI